MLQLATRQLPPTKPRPVLPLCQRIVIVRVGSRRLQLDDWLNDPLTHELFRPSLTRSLRWPRFG